MQEVDSPAVGLLLDTFHMHIEEKSTPAAILHSAGYIKHFHASENDRGTVGSGQLHGRRRSRRCAKSGYAGWVVVESFNAVIPELAGATRLAAPGGKPGTAGARQPPLFASAPL